MTIELGFNSASVLRGWRSGCTVTVGTMPQYLWTCKSHCSMTANCQVSIWNALHTNITFMHLAHAAKNIKVMLKNL